MLQRGSPFDPMVGSGKVGSPCARMHAEYLSACASKRCDAPALEQPDLEQPATVAVVDVVVVTTLATDGAAELPQPAATSATPTSPAASTATPGAKKSPAPGRCGQARPLLVHPREESRPF
jgi:hypothetical protein